MKFKIERKNLIDAMNYAVYAVENRPMIPVLACVIVEADKANKFLTLKSCNMQHKVEVCVEAEIETDGKIAVPAKKLLSLLKSFRGNEVFWDCVEDKVNIKGGTTEVTLVGLKGDDFPEFADFTPEYLLSVDKKQIQTIIKNGGYAFGKDDARKVLQGCCLEVNQWGVSVVSTDGKRLALSSFMTEKGSETVRQYVIPPVALSYISNLPADKIEFVFNSKFLAVKAENIFYATKLIDGVFPNYQQVIPQNFKYNVIADAEELINKLSTVSVMADETSTVDLEIGNSEIRFTIKNAADGILTDTMPVADGPTEPLTITFNPSLLLTTINAVDVSGDILLCVNDSYSQVKIQFDNDTLAILMPIRRK
jgi:DNA polymerase-3 subunit beta